MKTKIVGESDKIHTAKLYVVDETSTPMSVRKLTKGTSAKTVNLVANTEVTIPVTG